MAIDKDVVLTTALDLFERADKHAEYLEADREAALLYYYGERPSPPEEDRSSHISYDVFDSVESLKAKLLNMITANQKLVKFCSTDPAQDDIADMANQYVNDMILKRNEGYLVLHDAIFDGLLMRIGVVRCNWEECEKTEEQIARGVPEEAVGVFESQGWTVSEKTRSEVPPEAEAIIDAMQAEGVTLPALVDLTLTRQVPDNRVKLECIAPENFYLIEDPADNDQPDFMAERCAIMTGDLAQEYDMADIEQLPFYQYEDLEIMRIQYADHSAALTENELLESRREREVFKAYMRADFEKAGEMKFYEVIFGRNVLLDCRPVDFCPYFYWSPIRISHRTIGRAVADVTDSIQTAKTALRRGLLDNVVEGNIPRTWINEDLIRDMSEVMDRSVGGVVNTTDVDRAYRVDQPAPLPPGLMMAFETLEMEKQARTGFSSMAQGMNPDAINHQNARDTIEMYAKMGQQRPAQVARLFAEKLLKPMMRRILELGIKHENIDVALRMGPDSITANPQQWSDTDLDLDVAVALTEDDQRREAMTLLSLHQVMAGDPANSHLYPDKNRAAVLSRVAELMNVAPDVLLTGVESPEYQQSKQQENDQQQAVMQLQMQAQQMQMQFAQMQLQLQQLIADRDFQVKQAELQLKAKEQQHDAGIDNEKIELEHRELMLKAQGKAAEIGLERQQQRPVAID